MLLGLRTAGLVRGDVEEMRRYNIHRIFMPHGLGHPVGLDVHDPIIYSSLRPCGRIDCDRVLESGNVLTNEPGIYFIDAFIDRALTNDTQRVFLVADEINRYRAAGTSFGGVRIEDVVHVTSDGPEILSFGVPSEASAVEDWVRGK